MTTRLGHGLARSQARGLVKEGAMGEASELFRKGLDRVPDCGVHERSSTRRDTVNIRFSIGINEVNTLAPRDDEWVFRSPLGLLRERVP